MDDEELFRRIQDKKRGAQLEFNMQNYRNEAVALLEQIGRPLGDKDSDFVAGMRERLEDEEYEVSQRQVFWLRDIRDRAL